jgi:autotransporter-associated beta strand protein
MLPTIETRGRMPRLAALVALILAVVSGTAQSATRTWTGGGSTDNWSDAGNWGGTAPVNGDTLVWDATSTARLSSYNDISNLSVGSITYSAAPAGIVLSGNALSLTTITPTIGSSTGRITINNNLALAADASSLGDSGGIVLNGIVSGGTSSVSPSTSNTQPSAFYALYGANTFSGNFNLSRWSNTNVIANTLANSGVAQSLGTGSLVQFGVGNALAANLYYTGGTASTNKGFSIGDNNGGISGGVFANGTGALTWSGAQTVRTKVQPNSFTLGGFNTDANTWSSGIANNNLTGGGSALVNFTKSGRGSWTLSGANTFTGTFTVNSGRLILDYATSATVVDTARAPVLGGGTLEFKAASSGSSAQTLGNVTTAAGTGLSTFRVNQNGGTGMAVTLGTVTTTAGRTAVLYDLVGSADSSATIGTSIAPDTGTLGGILIRTASGAYDFAVNNGSAANPLSARAASATIGATNGSSSLDYVFITTGSIGSGSNSVAVSARSLRIAPTQNNQTMTIANVGTVAGGGGAGLIAGGGGLVYNGGANDFTIAAASGSNGVSLRSGNNTAGFLLNHMGSGTLTIGNRVYLGHDGGGSSAGSATPVGLFGVGTGLIDWQGGTNQVGSATFLTISGVTVRISGTTDALRLDNNTSSTTKGAINIVLNGSGVLEAVNGDITRNVGTGAGAIQWTGDGGFSASGGNRAVNLGGASGQFTWGGTNFVPSENALVLSSPYSDSRIDFQNPLALGSLQRVVQVANGSAAVDGRLSGVLSSGLTGGLVKEGAGTLELTAANTYTGETWVRAGGLLVAGSVAGSATSVASGAFVGGDGTISGNLALANGARFAFDTGSTLDLGGLLSLNSSFGVNSLVSTTGGAVDWANVADGTYTLMNTSFSFNTGNITNFGEANKQTGLASGKSAYFQQGTSPSSLQLVVVPEPAAMALAAVGAALAGLVAWRRRRI